MKPTFALSRRQALGAGAALASSPLIGAAPGASRPQLLRRPYQPAAGGPERDHYVYLPAGFSSEEGKKWPVLLFLHGNGERGDGKDELAYTMIHGPLQEAWVQGRDLPFVIVQPQLDWYTRRKPERRPPPPVRMNDQPPPPRNYGSRPTATMKREEPPGESRFALPEGWDMVAPDLLSMVDAALTDYRGDPDRVYLTGLSYGGYGTWSMASMHPDRWAAVAPVCGTIDPAKVKPIADAKLPIWIFEGGRDPVVKPEWVMAAARALEDAGHPEVRVTVHEDLAHNVWTRVYEGWDVYQWMLRNRRGANA
ncbi:MAG: prolyl oligopeptidase family serine peptidase [Bryobacterales bacterium]